MEERSGDRDEATLTNYNIQDEAADRCRREKRGEVMIYARGRPALKKTTEITSGRVMAFLKKARNKGGRGSSGGGRTSPAEVQKGQDLFSIFEY